MEVQQVKAKAKKGFQLLRKSMNDHFSIKNLHIQNNFKVVHDFSEPFDGDHTKIDYLRFDNCTFDKFPRAQILLDFIPNLSRLSLNNCELTKISREDLRGFEGLKKLWLDGNRIEKLPKGLFEHTPNLEIVSFFNNKITEIDTDILDPLFDLKYFDLTKNVVIDELFDIKNKVALEDLKAVIRKCNPIEKLKDEIQALKQENALLKQQIENSNKKVEAVKQENVQMKNELAELNEKLNNQKAEVEKLRSIPSDFAVIVNGKAFRVNKSLLKANSPMLAKFIDENDQAETLEVADISTDTFEEILKFMRTKIQPDENANLIELYGASAKLEMKELMVITAEILMQKVNAQNALDVMKLCQKYAHDKLHKKAFDEYKKNFE